MEDVAAGHAPQRTSAAHATRRGRLELICGPMFSGKTEELIKRLRRAQIARQRVVVFKPRLDNRYDAVEIVSHSRMRLHSIPVDDSRAIADHLGRESLTYAVIGVDEAQFFDDGIVKLADDLADGGVRVVMAGLELDYLGRPFGPMAELLVRAEAVTKQTAVCMVCGGEACRSQRVREAQRAFVLAPDDVKRARGPDAGQIFVGGDDRYEARCRRCFIRGIAEPTGRRVEESAAARQDEGT